MFCLESLDVFDTRWSYSEYMYTYNMCNIRTYMDMYQVPKLTSSNFGTYCMIRIHVHPSARRTPPTSACLARAFTLRPSVVGSLLATNDIDLHVHRRREY